MARYTGPGGGALRIGIPLELPTGLLDPALTELREAHPDTRVQARHLSTAEQLVALHSGEPDVGVLRERPSGPRFDALLVVREKLGVLLAAEQAAEVRRTGRHRAGCARRPAAGRISSLWQPRQVRRTDRDPARARPRPGPGGSTGAGADRGGEAGGGGARAGVHAGSARVAAAAARPCDLVVAGRISAGAAHLGRVAGRLAPP
ncbi:LysR substrate-binding domain-containing protein [Streptomyces durhamensis]|uniref:LysR substrate-binding domain-containing protein n=1 Tax=Streptomyces durhamensis TaxID=68194 RepID=UPI003CC92011